MKLEVGKNSVIASIITRITWLIASTLTIYLFCLYINRLMNKYNETLREFFDGYSANGSEFALIVLGGIVALLFALSFVYQTWYLLIGVHYYSKTTTEIRDNVINQTSYTFPYGKDLGNIIIDDISKITLTQSSIQRLLGCGNIIIKGYSNSNYSKTSFIINIEGIDSVLAVKESIGRMKK